MQNPGTDQASLHADLERLFAVLEAEIADFNGWWPRHFRAGEVWPLPPHVRGEPFCLERPFSRVSGQELIATAQAAIAQVRMTTAQNPVTSMRLPGWIALDAPATDRIQRINAARQALSDRLSAQFAGTGFTAKTIETYRARALRAVIPGVSQTQLFRKLHAFDRTPIVISFIWSGKGGSSRTISTAAKERERLEALINAKAQEQRLAPEEIGLYRELELLRSYADDMKLVIAKPNTPHPRVMLMFDSRSRWDAMPHAALPLFVYCPAEQPLPDVRPLQPYAERTDRRGSHAGTRRTLLSAANPARKIYLFSPPSEAVSKRLCATVRSTYGGGSKQHDEVS
jgi:hypothetical protein